MANPSDPIASSLSKLFKHSLNSRKRGRPSKVKEDNLPPRKRGKPSKEKASITTVEDDSSPDPLSTSNVDLCSRNCRNPVAAVGAQSEADSLPTPTLNLPSRKGGRPRKATAPVVEVQSLSGSSSPSSYEDPDDSDFDIKSAPQRPPRRSLPVKQRKVATQARPITKPATAVRRFVDLSQKEEQISHAEELRRRLLNIIRTAKSDLEHAERSKRRQSNASKTTNSDPEHAEGIRRRLSNVSRIEKSDLEHAEGIGSRQSNASKTKNSNPENDMAPGYRNNNSRRTGRGTIDHDVYEGLPVRQWRRDVVHVAPPPAQDGLDNQQDKWDVELPWGMPKDSHLLPQHAQDLLRAARSGRIYKRSLPIEEEVDDVDGILGEKSDKKEDLNKDKGFAAKTWKQIPRHMEGPDIDYLAKRRKGLQTPNQPTTTSTSTMTRVTVKRTDAAGNVYQEVLVVPQGQPVDGEIVTQTPLVDSTAAATQSAIAAPPARIISRKPPLPKGKRKGPGRGRKKKILAPTSVPGPSPAQLPATETAGSEQTQRPISSLEGTKINLKTESSTNEDTEMGDDSQHPSDDEGDDGEEGEEGEIIESDDDQDGSVDGETSTPTPAVENNGIGSKGGKSVPSGPPTAMKSVKLAHPSVVSEDRDGIGSPDVLSTEKATPSVAKEGSPLKSIHVAKEETSPAVEEKTTAETMQEPKSLIPESKQLETISTEPETQQPDPFTLSSAPATDPVAETLAPTAPSKEIPAPPDQEVEADEVPDEMLLDTIEPENLPADADNGVANVEGGEAEQAGSGQGSREESEFPDLMGSLERHLDGNRRD